MRVANTGVGRRLAGHLEVLLIRSRASRSQAGAPLTCCGTGTGLRSARFDVLRCSGHRSQARRHSATHFDLLLAPEHCELHLRLHFVAASSPMACGVAAHSSGCSGVCGVTGDHIKTMRGTRRSFIAVTF